MSRLRFTKHELKNFLRNQVAILFNRIPESCIVVKHSPNTSGYDKGGYASWTDWWKENIKEPVAPTNNICPCCQRTIVKNVSNYFVVGHIYDAHSRKGYLCPVCHQCNVSMKKWKFLAPKELIRERPKNL